MKPIVVLCPLAEEATAIRARLAGRPSPLPALGARAWRGRLGGRDAVVCVTGDGPAAEAPALAALAGAAGAIVAGVAGALVTGLEIGDIVAATELYHEADGRRLPAAGGEAVAAATGALAAPVVTARSLVSTPSQRRALAGSWDPPPGVADLESWHLVTAARAAGVPWAVLRAVSDTPTATLPRYLEASRGPGGSVRRGRVALSALLRPWTVPALIRLRSAVTLCSARLADACAALAAAGWPEGPPPASPDARNSGRAGRGSVGFPG